MIVHVACYYSTNVGCKKMFNIIFIFYKQRKFNNVVPKKKLFLFHMNMYCFFRQNHGYIK